MRPSVKLAAVLAVAVVAPLVGASGPALAQDNAAFRTTTLNLSAQGEARIRPDIVTLNLGVMSEAATAQAASADTSQKLAAVVAALKRAGVAERDIQTQYVQLQPRYSDHSNVPSQIVAHQASSALTVTVRDIGRAGALLDLAVGAGANLVQGVRFGLADPSGAEREARDHALRALQTEAAEVAAVMGQRVVRLVSVSTQVNSGIVVSASRMAAPMAFAVEPGELSIHGNASGVFELAPK
jgi:hypothetical protein